MAEQQTYHWQIYDFHNAGDHLSEQLADIEWSPPMTGTDSSLPEKARVLRIANQFTFRFFRAKKTERPFPAIVLQEVVTVDGEHIRTTEWVVNEAIVRSAVQRDRREGEADWATNPYVDEIEFTFGEIWMKTV